MSQDETRGLNKNPFAGEQVLQSALPFLLLHGSERTEGRGDVMKEYRLLPYSRDAALFW